MIRTSLPILLLNLTSNDGILNPFKFRKATLTFRLIRLVSHCGGKTGIFGAQDSIALFNFKSPDGYRCMVFIIINCQPQAPIQSFSTLLFGLMETSVSLSVSCLFSNILHNNNYTGESRIVPLFTNWLIIPVEQWKFQRGENWNGFSMSGELLNTGCGGQSKFTAIHRKTAFTTVDYIVAIPVDSIFGIKSLSSHRSHLHHGSVYSLLFVRLLLETKATIRKPRVGFSV